MNIKHLILNIRPRAWRSWAMSSLLGVFAGGIVLSVSFAAPDTDAPPTIDSFKIIQQRNIFDPNRRAGYIIRDRTNPTPRTIAFALVGTMSYSKGRFAFFDGTASDYKRVLEAGGNIAGYTVKEIGQNSVTLAANGKEFEMKIGTQMRQGNNKWMLYGQVIEEQPADETNGETTAVESSAPPSGSSPAANDILKRLMEQRQQELK